MTWFVLIITLENSIIGAIPFKDAMTCGDAIIPMYEIIGKDDPNLNIRCIDSGITTMRPQARPERN